MTPASALCGSASANSALRVEVNAGSAPRRLLATLEQHIAVSFVDDGMHADASLHIGESRSHRPAPPSAPTATLECATTTTARENLRIEQVKFDDNENVPWPFRGRTVVCTIPTDYSPLSPLDGECVLASTQAGTLWAVRTIAGCRKFRSALPLVEIPAGGSFAQVFSGSTFVANLPLLHLLAQFDSTGVGVKQGLRASFMFDDPNLHWPSYGYVNYADVLSEAERENFHVSFATIPLDTWFTHARTATQFRKHPDRLSLLVHGNDHTRHELARECSASGCSVLLQEALRRIERLERRAMVPVDRVMVPPHGACSERMLAAMPGAGFDGACLSSGSLLAHNPNADWLQSLGFRPAEVVRGCPVLPRWPLVATDESELLVAAYLGRPLILRGHHGDLREGLEILVRHARFINGLGKVSWTNNAELLRSSYRLRLSGTTAYLTMFARQVSLTLPAEVTTLAVESPAFAAVEKAYLVSGIGPAVVRALSHQGLPVAHGTAAVVVTIEGTSPRTNAVSTPGLKASSVLRRLLTESRDRLMPLTTT